MTREQRGPISSESQNPVAWAFLLVIEEIGVTVSLDVIVQVGVGIIAAVGTLVMPKKVPPKDECLDKYVACMDSPLGNLVVDKQGHSVCETCRSICKDKNGGEWPAGVKLTHRWQSCG